MISKKNFVDKVATSINNNEAALFVAAGLSASTGLTDWTNLLRSCADELGITINKDSNLYMIAQYYENEYGKTELIRKFENSINRINSQSDYLNAILDLGFREIWTTNYDTLIEDNLKRKNITPKVIHNDMDLNNFTDGGVHIYKMNGDITNPNNMVMSKSDLENYSITHQLMLTFFKRELISKSFVFLGYSFTDSLVLDALATIKSCLLDSCNIHYTIIRNKHSKYFDYFIQDLWKRYNIKALLVDEYSDIPNIIHSIKERTKERKVFISGSFDSLPHGEDDFADKLCNALVNSLYNDHFIISTGMGRKVGNYIAGHAFEYLSKYDIYDIEKYLLMRPFFEKMDIHDKTIHRKKMIEECKHAIFIFGKSPSKTGEIINSKGVFEEYQIAKALNKKIIAIPTTGYVAKEIFNEQKNNIIQYPYLEMYIKVLETETNPDKISEIVTEILNDCTNDLF